MYYSFLSTIYLWPRVTMAPFLIPLFGGLSWLQIGPHPVAKRCGMLQIEMLWIDQTRFLYSTHQRGMFVLFLNFYNIVPCRTQHCIQLEQPLFVLMLRKPNLWWCFQKKKKQPHQPFVLSTLLWFCGLRHIIPAMPLRDPKMLTRPLLAACEEGHNIALIRGIGGDFSVVLISHCYIFSPPKQAWRFNVWIFHCGLYFVPHFIYSWQTVPSPSGCRWQRRPLSI